MLAPYDRKTGQFTSKPLRMSGCIARLADADEPTTGYEQSYDDLKGDLLTVGWENHQMFEIEYIDMNGNVQSDDEEGHEQSDEVRGIFARFCAMSERQQAKFMYDLTMHICKLISVSVTVWEPSDEFVLEAIEEELSDADLDERARDAYWQSRHPFNPRSDFLDFIQPDLIHSGQQSVEQCLPNLGRGKRHRRGPRTMKCRRPKSYELNEESHCPKYGRQDCRHQLPRLEAKWDRRLAQYEARMEEFYSQDVSEHYPEVEIEYDFLTVRDQMRIPDWRISGDREMTQDDVDYFHGGSQFGEDDYREEFTADDVRLERSSSSPSWYRPHTSGREDFRSGRGDFDQSFDDWMDGIHDRCNCPVCMGDWDDYSEPRSATEELIDWFDGFADYPTMAEMLDEEAAFMEFENFVADYAYYPQRSCIRIGGKFSPTMTKAEARVFF